MVTFKVIAYLTSFLTFLNESGLTATNDRNWGSTMTFTFDIFFVLVNVTVRSYFWPTKKNRVNELGDQVIVGDDENDREAERIVHRQTLVIKKKRTLWL